MRSFDPADPWDVEQLAELNAEQWQIALLDVNPSYTGWGPHEDYMCALGGQWGSPVTHDGWSDSSRPNLDDLNEMVHFYFSLRRPSTNCIACDGSGHSPEAKGLSDTFHGGWGRELTDADRAALTAAGRHPDGGILGHDAINRLVLVEARCVAMGVPHTCAICGGDGNLFTSDQCLVDLTLWILHPRKGASRGWEILGIVQADLPEVFAYLRSAAERNAARFAAVPVQP